MCHGIGAAFLELATPGELHDRTVLPDKPATVAVTVASSRTGPPCTKVSLRQACVILRITIVGQLYNSEREIRSRPAEERQ